MKPVSSKSLNEACAPFGWARSQVQASVTPGKSYPAGRQPASNSWALSHMLAPTRPQQQVPSLLETPRDTQLHDLLQTPTEGEEEGCGFSKAQSAHTGLTQAGRETPRRSSLVRQTEPGAGAQMLFPLVLTFSPPHFFTTAKATLNRAVKTPSLPWRFRICHHR